jgi:hypothetical protein
MGQPVAVRIPRRPEVPGAPGMLLPMSRLIGSIYEELPVLPSWEDGEEAPTNPYPSEPPQSGTVRQGKTLSVPNLTNADAAQLAGIIAAWESSEPADRTLLAEFAKRLRRSREK